MLLFEHLLYGPHMSIGRMHTICHMSYVIMLAIAIGIVISLSVDVGTRLNKIRANCIETR
jgi:hypothetical protein